MKYQTQILYRPIRYNLYAYCILFFMFIGACAHETEFYSPDLEQLKEVEKKVMVSNIETPTLSKPLVALSDHEAFMNAYFGGNSQVMAPAIHRIADLRMIKENRKYERILDSYAQRLRLYEQGRLRRPPTPPVTPYTVPRRLYERILELYSNRSENDRVLYQLARIYESTDRFEKRKEMLKRLVIEYPASRYMSEVQFRLAEIYFEEGNYEEAMIAYNTSASGQDLSVLGRANKGAGERAKIALEEASKRREKEIALYKSGWSQMASGDVEGAMKIFQDLLDKKKTILERRPYKFDPMVMSWEEWDFLQEVLRGVVIAFSNWGPPKKLQQYFTSIGHRKYEYLLYQKLASLYLSRKRSLDAVKIYEMFIKTYPRDPESPGMALRIIDVYQRLKLLEPANRERIRFIKDFGKDSLWYKNASLGDRAKTNPLLKRTTYHLALFYHSEAQKLRRTKDYKKAIRWYRTFLKTYPEETEATRVNFLLAEGLYETGKYKEAVAEYEKTAYQYPLHQDSAEAGYAVIFARGKLLKFAIKDGEDSKTGPSALRVASACVQFAETFPSDERALETRLKAAEIYFHARRFEDARRQAEVVTVAYVKSRHPAVYQALLLNANSYFEENAYTHAAEIYRKINATEIPPRELTRDDMLSLNPNTKRIMTAFYTLILLICLNVSFASARETQPEQGKQELIESRIAEAKVQLLRKIVKSSANSDLLWLSPAGVTIVIRQSGRVSQTLQTVTLRGSGANRVFHKSHKYTFEEATALRKGGVYRAPRIGRLEADLSINATVTMVDSENESHQVKTTVSIKRDHLPVVVELMIIPSPEGPEFKKRIMRKPTPTQIKELLTRHIQYLIDTESYLEAAVLVLTVLEKGSKEFDPQEKWKLQLAKVYLEWGMDAEAERLLNQTVAKTGMEQEIATALFYLGKLRYRQGDYKKATESLLKARAHLTPSLLPEALYLAGNSLLHQGSYSKAVELLVLVPKGNGLYPFALFSIGLAHLKTKETSSAIKKFQRLIELNFNNGELHEFLVHRAHITLGFFLVDERQFKEALETFSNIPPNSLYTDQAQFGVGWTYFKKGDCDKAVVVFQDLVSQWPDSIYSQEARLKVGTCYAELLAYRRAVESYQEALRSYSVENEKLNTLQDDLAKEPLSLWLKAQREKKLDGGKRSAFIRNLSAEKAVQKAIAAFEGIEDLSAQMSRLENNIDDVSLLDSPRQQLQQLHRESEIEVKKVISERIEDLQKLLEKRSVQADIGLLQNFRLID